MKSIRKTLTLLLALVLLCSIAPIGITANAALTVSFTMEGFYDYEQASEALALINDARTEAGIPTLTCDEALTDYAMTRAAEIYVFANSNRPDGSNWKNVLETPSNTADWNLSNFPTALNLWAHTHSAKEVHLPNTITAIGDSAFRDCENITDVYFYGAEAQWNNIEIGYSNDCLAGSEFSLVTIHFVGDSNCFHKNSTILPAVAPTCEKAGLSESKVCTDCDEVLTEQEVMLATGIHTYKKGVCTMCGKEFPTVIENPFTDVSKADWYYNPVMWAKENNVTGGTSATTFGPNNGCTRAQVVTFLYKVYG